jgi:amylosucrase
MVTTASDLPALLLKKARKVLRGATLDTFTARFERNWEDLHSGLEAVYTLALEETLQRLMDIMLNAHRERSSDLKLLDLQRSLRPDWFQSEKMIGYVCYTERFANTLRGVREKVAYLEELGVQYLHLMPLLKPRSGPNDGGYAVEDYRQVRSDLGNMNDLEDLANDLHSKGISLCLDLVINHVAKEHDWAKKAMLGEEKYQNYFYLYPDRKIPDAFELTLPEVFPDFAAGNFTWNDQAEKWVWTTFNSYQWDLNWSNPEVFLEFAEIILFLANKGVDVFRLDAIAFIWKRMGTDCQNQSEVHSLTQALRAMTRMVAPAVLFKAEAIVAPQQLIGYLGQGRYHGKVSDLAYHNSLMVQLWSSLASRDTRLMTAALERFPHKPSNTAWGTYFRCHDDIGWAISDEDASRVGISGPAHRAFLSEYYAGLFEGSAAKGLVFQENLSTGDRRISGSAASLAGLEAALESGDERLIGLALERLLLAHAVVLGYGGIPLLYMGDELALINDYSFMHDPKHAPDNRWVHRPQMDWREAEKRHRPYTLEGRMFGELRRLIQARKSLPHLHAATESQALWQDNPHLLYLERLHPLGRMVQLYNFSEEPQTIDLERYQMPRAYDHLGGRVLEHSLELVGYGRLWLTEADLV